MLAREQREAAQIKNELARGELVHLDVVEKMFTPLFYNFREHALGTPGKIAAVAEACGGDRVLVFRIIDDQIREMLDELADGKSEAVSRLRPRRRRAVVDDEDSCMSELGISAASLSRWRMPRRPGNANG